MALPPDTICLPPTSTARPRSPGATESGGGVLAFSQGRALQTRKHGPVGPWGDADPLGSGQNGPSGASPRNDSTASEAAFSRRRFQGFWKVLPGSKPAPAVTGWGAGSAFRGEHPDGGSDFTPLGPPSADERIWCARGGADSPELWGRGREPGPLSAL